MAEITQAEYEQRANSVPDAVTDADTANAEFAARSSVQDAAHFEPQTTHRRSRLFMPLLVIVGTVGAGLLYGLGYVAQRLASEGTLAYTVRSANGWKYWLPGILLPAIVGAATAL